MTTIESLVADVAIIGAGLCGLALARALHAQDISVVVIEARDLAAAWREFALELNARLVHACPDIDPAAVPA